MDALVELLFIVILALIAFGLLAALLFSVIKRPGWWVAGLALLVLVISCQRSEAAELRFEVSIVGETADDRPAIDEAVAYAAQLYRSQLGIELAVSYADISTVAAHTKPEALLDEVKLYRLDRPQHRAADATVLFTRRELTRGYEGIATIGPACSASASAVVRLRADGLDGQVLAHELLHTLGVPHDHDAGYLMSVSLSRNGSDTMSADSVLTVKAAPLAECMAKPVAATVPAGTPTEPSGGGGAFDVWWVFALLLIALGRYTLHLREQLKERQVQLEASDTEIDSLMSQLPSAYCLRDVLATEAVSNDRTLRVRFATIRGMAEFHLWLRRQSLEMKRPGRW